MSERTAPASSCQFTLSGTTREVFMSFAQLNRLTYLVGVIDNLASVMLNTEMRAAILVDLITERDEKGKVIRAYTEEELNLSQDDALNLLDFAQEHIMDFFVKAAERSHRLVHDNKDRLSSLTPTPTGQAS